MPKKRSFPDKLESILECDDKVRFLKLLQNHPTEITNTKPLLEKIAELGARKCLLAWVDGKVCYPPPALDFGSAKTLAYVTYFCPEPRVIEFMLKHCNAIPLVNVSCTIGLIDGLPIQFALVHLSYLEHVYFWSQGDSLIKLIFLLCQWKTKPILDCVHLLAQYTNSINSIAWTFVQYGALKQFGPLLLVARNKVVAPFDTGLTIRDYITSELNSFSENEGGSEDEEQAEYIIKLKDALTLLQIFEEAGDLLSSYYSSMQKYVSAEDAIINVCKALREAKVPIYIDDFSVHNYMDHIRIEKINVYKLVAPSGQPCISVLPARQINSLFFHGNLPQIKPVWKPTRFRTLLYPLRRMSTTAGNARMIPKPLEHVHVNPILKHLAYPIIKLRKGLRIF